MKRSEERILTTHVGSIPRPPRTFVQQNTVIRNLTSTQTTINVTNVRNLTLVSPLSRPAMDWRRHGWTKTWHRFKAMTLS